LPPDYSCDGFIRRPAGRFVLTVPIFVEVLPIAAEAIEREDGLFARTPNLRLGGALLARLAKGIRSAPAQISAGPNDLSVDDSERCTRTNADAKAHARAGAFSVPSSRPRPAGAKVPLTQQSCSVFIHRSTERWGRTVD